MLSSSIDSLWLKRWNQDIEGAAQGLAAFKNSDHSNELEVQLLEASLMRAKGENKSSSSLIGKIYRQHKAQDKPAHFLLSFELGLDYWCSEDVTGALEHFLSAEKTARTAVEKIFALSNLLLCLEHLGLPRQEVEEKFKKELETIPADQAQYVRHVAQQFLSYELRKDFFSGRSLEGYKYLQSEFKGQPSYFYFWIQELPYIKSATKSSAYEDMFAKNYLWQAAYRLGTLRGEVSLNDKAVLRLDDGIYRLYLWVWRWISGDTRASIETILFVLESLVNILEIEKLSKENELLLRNSLAWLFLLNPKVVKKMGPIYDKLKKSTSPSEYRILQDEFAFIQYMSSSAFLKDEESFEGHAYFNDIGRKLRTLRKGTTSCPILEEYVMDFKRTISSQEIYNLIVDLAKQEIRTLPDNQYIRSASLSNFMHLIVKNEVVDVADIDPEFAVGTIGDKRKLYNLCARAKSLCPGLILTIRDNKVYRESSARSILILHSNRTEPFKNMDFIEAPKTTAVPVNIQAAKFIFKEGFIRNDFQKAFNLSKATACRFIQLLEKDGSLEKQGNGKNIYYQWRSHE